MGNQAGSRKGVWGRESECGDGAGWGKWHRNGCGKWVWVQAVGPDTMEGAGSHLGTGQGEGGE